MEKIKKYLNLIIILSIISVQAQHPIQWLKNENFSISSDQYTITQNIEYKSAHLTSKHYLDAGEDGYIEIYNLEDLKDFSVYLEAEDKLGNTKKSYGLLFNHILDNSTSDDNQSLDSIIALQYSKYKLEKTTSKDGTKELKTRDFKILDHGKLVDELDDPKAAIAIPYNYAKTIRIEKTGNQIFIKKNGVIIKTINNVLQTRYRIGVHSYNIDPLQVNQISINTNFLNTNETLGVPTNPVGTDNNISCVDNDLNLDHNWTNKCTYDITGRVIGTGISYFNSLGKPTQTQSIDLKTKKVWMSQPIYDSQGRAMFNSSSAPIGSTFGYKDDFIMKEDGIDATVLTKSDLEADPYHPPKLSTTDNSLGKYYSENNDTSIPGSEYQDITSYPYSRTIFSELNPGAVLQTLGGNKIDYDNDGVIDDDWKQGFSYTVPATQELYYYYGKDYFEEPHDLRIFSNNENEPIADDNGFRYYECEYYSPEDCGSINTKVLKFQGDLEVGRYYGCRIRFNQFTHPKRIIEVLNQVTETSELKIYDVTEPWYNCNGLSVTEGEIQEIIDNPNQHLVYKKAYKTVSVDIDGNESVVFTDAEGKTLAAGLSGNTTNLQEVVSLIGEQGYVDIHIPKNSGGNIQFLGGDYTEYKIWNLKTEKFIDPTPSILDPGFYRIEALDDRCKERPALTYINSSNEIEPVFPNYNMGVRYYINYYDLSINYYDKIGNLKETVQPKGYDNTNLVNKTFNFPNNSMKSTHKYNSIGQLLETTSPDEGQAKFLYREDGQIRFSQNSKQNAVNEVSYTNYDNLGRPVESGVVTTDFTTLDPLEIFFTGTRKEQHFTFYDLADENLLTDADGDGHIDDYLLAGIIPANSLEQLLNNSGIPSDKYIQSFLASNVSVTYAKPLPNEPITNITWYSYDIYGRVKWLVQYINGLGVKTIDYVYDPITSNVTDVIYQKHNSSDYFAHHYKYDNDTNQLIKVYTSYMEQGLSSKGIIKTQNVTYSYYENGALRRTQYAHQGVDYVYNLNGQLKSINHPSLDPTKDPGGDQNDLFGMAIDYYNGDYTRSNTPTPIESTPIVTSPSDPDTNLNQYNGNIKALRWKTNGLTVPNHSDGDITVSNAQVFTYNDKYWLKKAEFGIANTSDANIDLLSTNQSYNVFGIDYDKNGNINHLNRNAIGASNAMDRLSYSYKPNSNQLDHVTDTVTQDTGLDDIKNQDENNYIYNSIGQLVTNNQDGIIYKYNASGLVTQIDKFETDNNGYQTIFENNYNELFEIDKIENWSFDNSQITMSIKDFTKETSVNVKGENYSDFCEELAKVNIHGLEFVSGDNFEVTKNLSLETDGQYILSFNAILKRLIQLNAHTIELNISILDENNQLIENTTVSTPNGLNEDIICDGLFELKNINFAFTAPTDLINLKIEANLLGGNSETFGFVIDNFKIEKFTTETALKFYYDDKGKRIRKEILSNNGNTKNITYYVRDASGSPMAIYKNIITFGGQRPPEAHLVEQSVYGLSRLGVFKNPSTFTPAESNWDGYTYQLTDHLGNVRATFINLDDLLVASVTNATDYYPFGMPMPNRRITDANGYRYAYQGQEKDPETGKEAFELRLWDGRIGRWLTTDPAGQYHSPYLGMGNNPINSIDPDGAFERKWWAQFINFLIGGDGVYLDKEGDKKGEYYIKRTVNLGYEQGMSLEYFYNSPIEFYANANGKIDSGLQAGFDVKFIGANIAIEGGHNVKSLLEANFDTRKGKTFLYNRYGKSAGNYYSAETDRTSYWGIGGIVGTGSKYETSTSRDYILGVVPRIGRQINKEVSVPFVTAIENYNKDGIGSTMTYKWSAAASAKVLLGVHLNFEIGVDLNYLHNNVLGK